MKNLAMLIVYHIGKALKMKELEMRELFEDGIQMMRMNYYPPCPEPEKVIGLTNHSDPQGITLLLQLNDVAGLHIKKDGMWIPVKPLPNAFIVNIGDIIEVNYTFIYQIIYSAQ
jgi:isopenicillin N synthase-like dioxygenase